MDEREAAIRLRAYAIWEAEGRPAGRDHEHWMRAEHELDTTAPPVPVTTDEQIIETPTSAVPTAAAPTSARASPT